MGYQVNEMRLLPHSVLNCFFRGAFGARMLLLRSERVPHGPAAAAALPHVRSDDMTHGATT
ncbi:DUF6529 family protein [Streptomyces sp. NPDC102462]|uniref:DUF6529 family protein n=1 Tax=Streptomyces sp. NPDC102462 TaxID=3366178 RepID=UPI0037F6B428